MKRIVAIAFFALALPVGAFAHAKLLGTVPADGATVTTNVAAIELKFSEELQNVPMNSVVVTAPDGTPVDAGAGPTLSTDLKVLQLSLKNLANGVYTVDWRALSSDDHTMKGKFSFRVAAAAAPTGEAKTVATPPVPAGSDTPSMMNGRGMAMQMAGTSWTQSAVRWLLYTALSLIFGGFMFALFVLKPLAASSGENFDASFMAYTRPAGKTFVRLGYAALLATALAVFVSLILQTAAVMDIGTAAAMSPSEFIPVITRTSFGGPWLLQVIAIVILTLIIFTISRALAAAGEESTAAGIPPWMLYVGLLTAAVLLLPTSLTGHARAAAAEYRYAILANWLHLIAVASWVGGLFYLAVTVPRICFKTSGELRHRLLAGIISRFTVVAMPATAVIVLTGIYSSWVHVAEFSELLTETYGQVLLLKIILFIPMMALGGINGFIIKSRADHAHAGGSRSEDEKYHDMAFARSVKIEATIGIAVLLLAAILAFLPPARQHEMQMNDTIEMKM